MYVDNECKDDFDDASGGDDGQEENIVKKVKL